MIATRIKTAVAAMNFLLGAILIDIFGSESERVASTFGQTTENMAAGTYHTKRENHKRAQQWVLREMRVCEVASGMILVGVEDCWGQLFSLNPPRTIEWHNDGSCGLRQFPSNCDSIPSNCFAFSRFLTIPSTITMPTTRSSTRKQTEKSIAAQKKPRSSSTKSAKSSTKSSAKSSTARAKANNGRKSTKNTPQKQESLDAQFAALRQLIKDTVDSKLTSTTEKDDSITVVVPHSVYPDGYHCNPKDPLPFIGAMKRKNMISFYSFPMYCDRTIVDWFQKEYPKHMSTKLDMGKSCIRFKKRVPYDLVRELIKKIQVDKYIASYESNFHPTKKVQSSRKKRNRTD